MNIRPRSAVERSRRKNELARSLLRDASGADMSSSQQLLLRSSGSASSTGLELPNQQVTRASTSLREEIAELTRLVEATSSTNVEQASAEAANAAARMELAMLEEELEMTRRAIEYLQQTENYVNRKPVPKRRESNSGGTLSPSGSVLATQRVHL